MNATTAHSVAASAKSMPGRRLRGAYLAEARSECLRYLRNPAFMLPIMLFPGMFYLLFGVILGAKSGPDAARYLLASYGVFGVMSPGLFGFGVSLALERDNGLLTLKRALPMPPGAYLLGKMLMAMLAAGVVIVLLLVMALTLGHVSLSFVQMGALLLTGVFGVLPFCAMGMWVGTLIKGQGAPGMLQLIYLPMAFLSGLWFPLSIMPELLQDIAPVWPSYHLNVIAMNAVGVQHTTIGLHVGVLLGVTAFFMLSAARRLRREG